MIWLFRFVYFARAIVTTLFIAMLIGGLAWHFIFGPTCEPTQTTSTGIKWQVCH